MQENVSYKKGSVGDTQMVQMLKLSAYKDFKLNIIHILNISAKKVKKGATWKY